MKIKLVHLLSSPEDEREQKSIASLSRLQEFGVQYVQHINAIHNSPVLGCFLAHKRAIIEEFSDDLDFLLVCECDCVLRFRPEAFVRSLKYLGQTVVDNVVDVLCIGSNGFVDVVTVRGIHKCRLIAMTHCLLYPINKKDNIFNVLEKNPWMPYDAWLSAAFGENRSIAVTQKRLAIQSNGYTSVIDTGCVKNTDWREPCIRELPPDHPYRQNPEAYFRMLELK
jgi:hypothetical protein